MRRGLSILLILFFSLGPLTAVFRSSDESRLPACCRRHGVHQCSMAVRTAKFQSGSEPSFTAPSTCPLYPGQSALLITAPLAIAGSVASLHLVSSRAHDVAANFPAPLSSPIGVRAGRGPPQSD